MYQYVFTTSSKLSFTLRSATDLIETAPELPSLDDFMPEEQHNKMLQDEKTEKEAAQAAQRQQVQPHEIGACVICCCVSVCSVPPSDTDAQS